MTLARARALPESYSKLPDLARMPESAAPPAEGVARLARDLFGHPQLVACPDAVIADRVHHPPYEKDP